MAKAKEQAPKAPTSTILPAPESPEELAKSTAENAKKNPPCTDYGFDLSPDRLAKYDRRIGLGQKQVDAAAHALVAKSKGAPGVDTMSARKKFLRGEGTLAGLNASIAEAR